MMSSLTSPSTVSYIVLTHVATLHWSNMIIVHIHWYVLAGLSLGEAKLLKYYQHFRGPLVDDVTKVCA